MRIHIDEFYSGPITLEPGENEVSEEIGEYLVSTFNGPPFHVRKIVVAAVAKTKPRAKKPGPSETNRGRAK
jgi:hypothetical protein